MDNDGSPNPAEAKLQLQSRLVDHGFSNLTMPTVKRPVNSLSENKPLVARLNSLNRNLIKEVKQPQTSVLSNVEKPFVPIAPPLPTGSQSQFTRSSIVRGKMPIQKTVEDEKAGSMIIRKRGNSQVMGFGRSVPIEASSSTKQINEDEIFRVRELIDLMRDKYLERTRFYRSKTGQNPEQPPGSQQNSTAELIPATSQSEIKPLQSQTPRSNAQLGATSFAKQAEGFTAVTPAMTRQDTASKKPDDALTLDDYIELLRSGNKRIDEFLYLMKNPANDDFYDLVLKNYFETRGKPGAKSLAKMTAKQLESSVSKDYYTISIKGLCHFKDGKPIEFIGLSKWLEEREIFHRIKRLEFFSNFRQWKTIKMWRNSYRNFKNKVAKKNLEEKLLFKTPELKFALISTKESLYEMSKNSLFDLHLSKEGSQDVNSFDQFLRVQEEKAKLTQSKIRDASKKITDIVTKSVEDVLEKLRKEVNSDISNNPNEKNKNTQNFRSAENPYENLCFQDHLTYDKRSMIRKDCARFVRFFYLIDVLAIDTLIKIYINSFKSLIDEVEDLSHVSDNFIFRDVDKTKPIGRKDPMFQLEVQFDCSVAQALKEFKTNVVEVPEFRFPKMEDEETKPSDYKDFNILTFPFLIPEIAPEEFNEQQKNYLEYREARTYSNVILTNIQEKVCWLNPKIDTFLDQIEKLFNDALTHLQAFSSFAKHHSMKKYIAILEEWQEKEDEKEETIETTILSPQEFIDHEEKHALEKSLKGLITSEFDRSLFFLEEYREFLQQNWEYKRFDMSLILNRRLARPGQTFVALLNLIEYQKSNFETQIPFQADVGLFRIQSSSLKNALIKNTKDFEENISHALPVEIHKRFSECKEWFEASLAKLKLNATAIEGFVDMSRNLKEVEKNLGYYRDLLKTTKEVLDTVKKFQIEIQKETVVLDSECKTKEGFLTTLINQVNDTLSKNQEVFSRDITLTGIPTLEKKCRQLEETLNQPHFYEENDVNRMEELSQVEVQVNEVKSEAQQLNQFEEVLGMKRTKFDSLISLLENLHSKKLLWESHYEWQVKVEGWKKSPFERIEVKEIQEIIDRFQKNVSRCRKTIPLNNKILSTLDKSIKSFSSLLPVVLALRNKNLKENHIQEIEAIIKKKLDTSNLTFEDLLTEEVLEHQKKIIGVSVQVEQEIILKQKYNEIDEQISKMAIPLKPFKEDVPKDATFILDDIEPLMNILDKLILSINTIFGSRYLKEHKKLVTDKRKDILMIQEMINEWAKFQKNFIYLESIFSQPEIKKHLMVEVKEFEDAINRQYKSNVKKISNSSLSVSLNAVKGKTFDNFLQTLQKHNEILIKLSKKINDFLDLKREAYPRFYFLSNDELVYVLANYDNPNAVHIFLGKMFENVKRVDFGQDMKGQIIQGIIAREGEVLPFKSSIEIKTESADKWMKKFEEAMYEAVARGINSFFGPNGGAGLSKKDFYTSSLAQSVSVITQVLFTNRVETYLEGVSRGTREDGEAVNTSFNREEEYEDMLSEFNKNLETLTMLVRTPGYSQPIVRTIVATITAEVHNRDVCELIGSSGADSVDSFVWQQQLRHYAQDPENKGPILVSQINAKQRYGGEYYGPTSRIVITPLTDRCWITILSALRMKLGAAPAGPAGTGKTESTKDLAKSLARFCLVFNCSDQIDYKIMEKLFRGVIKQGAWTCLDEFNRIDIEVLSVVAQQLLEMRNALLTIKNESEFMFCGMVCKLNDTCGVFITMNPGYAGRTELPDNLKALFRPISMMIPDYALIAQILLFSEGFSDSKVLAQKMIKLFKLSSEQLSQQKHYDFGMRAVKSVLELAGKLKREEPDENESVLLIRALKDLNVPKFTEADLPLFNELIKDLFPQVDIPKLENESLRSKAVELLAKQDLQPRETFIEKVLQTYQTINVRFGTMIVGAAMVGKSTLIKLLADSMTELSKVDPEPEVPPPEIQATATKSHLPLKSLKEKKETAPKVKARKVFDCVEYISMNPKSVSMGELYGVENLLKKEWSDGLASHHIRVMTNSEDPGQKWVIFDGPVDALWIENMNSVLDDSRMLCLSNGQRIRLRNEMRIFFEVDSLEQASPATISRCGMVFISNKALGWESIVKTWLARFVKAKQVDGVSTLSSEVVGILEGFFTPAIDQFREFYTHPNIYKPIEAVLFQCVNTLCRIIDALATEENGFKPESPDEFKIRFLSLVFVFAAAWGFGGSLIEKESEKFDALLKKKFQSIVYPNENITSCMIDFELVQLRPIADTIPKYSFDIKKPFWDILVPTVDTTKMSNTIEMLIKVNDNVFVTGPTGVGKSAVVSNLLKGFANTLNIDTIKYNFSAQTSSKELQDSLDSTLTACGAKKRSARPGRRNVVYIDDVNMPALEEFGAQPPIELLRQMLDQGGYYDRKEMNKIEVTETTLLCVAAPPQGGRHKISQRFSRHFHMLAFPNANSQVIGSIYSVILENYFSEFEPSIKAITQDVVHASIEVYERIKRDKLPTMKNFHYTFNLRDLSKVFMGITLASSQTVSEPRHIYRLWGHEVMRVFHDRLTSSTDTQWLIETTTSIAESAFRMRADDLAIGVSQYSSIFTLQDDVELYEEIIDRKKLIKTLEASCEDYNDKNHSGKLDLVFFEEAVSHILRIVRVLKQSRGNLLLIGLSGLGKSSLTNLAVHICGQNLITLESAKGLDSEGFKEWARTKILNKVAGPEAGLKGAPLTLLVPDSQIGGEFVLEEINNLLNTGEIPNAYPKDEKEKLEKGLGDVLAEKMKALETSDVWKLFVERVRDQLHIVLSMSPVGDSLRVSCRKFPALVDCTTIDWFDEWPASAIQNIGSKLIAGSIEERNESICSLLETFHSEAQKVANNFAVNTKRKYYVTPKLALDNINLLLDLYQKKQKEWNDKIATLSKGSVKLKETGEIVRQLKLTLEASQPILEEQKKKTEVKLIELEEAKKIANEKKEVVEHEERQITKKTDEIDAINKIANEKLKDATPKLEKTEREVRDIDRKELARIRILLKPADSIQFILMTVMIVLEKDVKKFEDCRPVLNDLNLFIEQLIDKINSIKTKGFSVVSQSVFTTLSNNLQNEYFSEKSLEKNNLIRPLALWCKAIREFIILKRDIEPLERNAKELNEKLTEAKIEMNAVKEELAQCKSKLQSLQDEFKEMDQKRFELEEEIIQTQLKLSRAEKLTSLLSSEGKRWEQTIDILNGRTQFLLGEVFLSSSMVTYMGPLTAAYRRTLQKEWIQSIRNQGVPISDAYNFLEFMSDPLELLNWRSHGLPSDEISQSSAVSAMSSLKWPMMIDPQFQANKWLKNSNESLVVIKANQSGSDLAQNIEKVKQCLTNGYNLMVEDCLDVLDSWLEPLVCQQQYVNPIDQRILINFNNEKMDYHEDFKLFLVTKIANPQYLPDIFIRTNVINFTVTPDGLQEQLLAELMILLDPQVEQVKNSNIEKISVYKKNMVELEKKILTLLVECKVSPVEDENLIQALEVSKTTSIEISEKLIFIEQTTKEIDLKREIYVPVASRSSGLFFVITDISLIDPMYQYSLQYITKLFKNAVNETIGKFEAISEGLTVEKKIFMLQDNITKMIYKNISRGLFEAHKTIFSLMITISFDLQNKVLPPEKWELFLKGSAVVDKSIIKPNPDVKTISEAGFVLLQSLQGFTNFQKIYNSLEANLGEWRKFIASEECFKFDFGNLLDKNSIAFDKLLLTKIFKPEKVLFAIIEYIQEKIGSFFITNTSNSIEQVWKESDCLTPIIYVLSQGADPSAFIKSFGEEQGFKLYERLWPISLGQGQGALAEKHIERGITEGCWVLLENCHLAKTWMPELEKKIEALQRRKDVKSDFRLFLTSMPADYFPVSVLQNGIKVTTEPPRGIKANLTRSISSIKQSFLDSVPLKMEMGKMVAGISVFHAIIQERRKFGSLGWNIRYEFNDSDLETAKDILQIFLEGVTERYQIPWTAISFLTGLITYGGRITDEHDAVQLRVCLNKFYTESLLEDRFKFCSIEEYKFPKVCDRESLLSYVAGLPLQDEPELFGMHRNANVAYQIQEAEKIISTITSVGQGGSTSADGGADKRALELIKMFMEPQTGIGLPIQTASAHKDLFKLEANGLYSPLSIVLLQEVARFNTLIDRLRDSLISLESAVQGKSVMSAELDKLFSSLLSNRVPELWASVAYPSLKPLASWFKDLKERIAFFMHWLEKGTPAHFWLPAFFFPQGFLTGVMQTHARRNKLPIDRFSFLFKVTDLEKGTNFPPPEEGVYISGLFLEAAVWDRRRKAIVDAQPGEVHYAMPPIHFLPKEHSEAQIKGNVFLCPLYKTLARAGTLSTTGQSTNFIHDVGIPCDKHPDTWVMRGVAMFCQLNN